MEQKISNAIGAAEEQAISYSGIIWHVVQFESHLAILNETCITPHDLKLSIYNTKDKRYNDMTVEEYLTRECFKEEYIVIIYDCSNTYLDKPQVHSVIGINEDEVRKEVHTHLDQVEIDTYDIMIVLKKDITPLIDSKKENNNDGC